MRKSRESLGLFLIRNPAFTFKNDLRQNLLIYVFYRLNEITVAALASVGKGLSSRSDEGRIWAETSTAGQASHQAGGSNAFKVGHDEQHIRQSEDEFSSFLDGIESLSSDSYVLIQSHELDEMPFFEVDLTSKIDPISLGVVILDMEHWKITSKIPGHVLKPPQYYSLRQTPETEALRNKSNTMEKMYWRC